MKSKSFDLKKSSVDNHKHNKTFDFSGYYKSTETSKINGERVPDEVVNKEGSDFKSKGTTPKHERSHKKKKNKAESIDISLIDGAGLGQKQLIDGSQHTSTPKSTNKAESKVPIVKSIIKKNSSFAEDNTMDGSNDTPNFKSKKRNKSVSFMLDDNEEVAIKKTKSNDSLVQEKINYAKKKSKLAKSDLKKMKIMKKQMQAEKENNDANMATATDHVESGDTPTKKSKKSDRSKPQSESVANSDGQSQVNKEKTKLKKVKKQKEAVDSEPTEIESNNNEDTEHRVKKLKKKKRQSKRVQNPDTTEPDGEPASKSRKKEIKPDIVAEDLENLTIGDNPHTLTNLLDEMTVLDQDKKKKKKRKLRKRKDKESTTSVSNSETTDLEKIEEGKEKIKWKKRKWNKDKKADIEGKLATTVLVENLPLSILMDYKAMLSDLFGKCGIIQRIGVAEFYPKSEPEDVFTTTVQFYSEGAATKALEENNTDFHGSLIRVSHPLPPTQTTVVVRSYGELTEHAISTVFASAGRVRSVKLMVKGRKAMATAFVEFDGPIGVERAIKMAAAGDVRVGGKKIHVSRYELRTRNGGSRKPDKATTNVDSDNEGGSEDSDD